MFTCFECMFLLLPLVGFYQLYRYSVSRKGIERQRACLRLGVVYLTIGVFCMAFHNIFLVLAGIVLLMLGLRLAAHGLDRANKSVFIDRYNDDLP